MLDVNVVGVFLPCKYAIPHLIARGGGRLVNVAGTSGPRGYPKRVGYPSSKWAVRGLTRTLALELGPRDITVTHVYPNVTKGGRMDRTDMPSIEIKLFESRVEDDGVAARIVGAVADGLCSVIGEAAREQTWVVVEGVSPKRSGFGGEVTQ